jgi:translation initiation factor 2B subunit (eIF-2B alpha/beta/delta family)
MSATESFSKILLDMEADLGTRDTAEEVLTALEKAIRDVESLSTRQFDAQFNELLLIIKNTQPRMGLIIDDFYQIWQAAEGARIKSKTDKEPEDTAYLSLKKIILDKVLEIKKHDESDMKQIIKNGVKEINENDTILLHSHSNTVLDIIKQAAENKQFQCIVAEQEYSKTQQIIFQLNKAKIPFSVVPEYMLSHVEDLVNKVFLGAVTINSFLHVVGDAGSNALVSEFQGKVPIFLFMTSSKCSFWEAESLHHSFKEQQMRSHIFQTFEYKRIKYSHDRVPLNMFNYIITEKKKYSAGEMETWYQEEYKKREEWRKTFIKTR